MSFALRSLNLLSAKTDSETSLIQNVMTSSKRKRTQAKEMDDNVSTLSSVEESGTLQPDIGVSTDGIPEENNAKDKPTRPKSSSKRSRSKLHSFNRNVVEEPSKYPYNINPKPEGRQVRIYSDGIFDCFHFGHAKALRQAKEAFPDVYLMVGVCDDESTHRMKGKTVLTEQERYESVRHCKWVDEVIEAAPWVIDQEFLDKHQIDYVAHDDAPYQSQDSDDIYHFVKESGKFLPIKRTEGISTSDIITRIVRDYDQYLRRNLERGVSAKELNIGFFKEQEVKFKKSASEIRDSIRQNWHGTREEFKNEITGLRNELAQTFSIWEERSQEFVRGFAALFGAEGVVDKIFRRRSNSVNSSDSSSASSGTTSPTREDLEYGWDSSPRPDSSSI